MAALFHKHRGISLVELMVGVVIGMIAVIVIMQVALTFEGQKRATVGSAGALDEGAVGLYALRREIQNAGYGISDPELINCPVHGHSQLQQCNPSDPVPPPGQPVNFRLLPIIITQGPGGAADNIAVNYSNSSMLASSVTLQRKFEGDEGNINPDPADPAAEKIRLKLSNAYGFAPGDVVVLSHPLAVDSAGNRLCSLYEITGMVGDEAEHRFSCYTKPGAPQPDSSRYNKSGGLYPNPLDPATSPVYPVGARVFNLGQANVSSLFSVNNNGQLVLQSQMLPGAAATILFENVISFQAQYGFDARPGSQNNMQIPAQNYVIGAGGYSNVIEDADSSGTAGDTGDWMRMGAVRVAIVVRNKYAERPDAATGKCNATNTLPAWTWGSIPEATLDPLDTDEWKCYRYRAFETVIPLRNLYWRTAS